MDIIWENATKTGSFYFNEEMDMYVIVMRNEINSEEEYQTIFETFLKEYHNHPNANLMFNNTELKKSPSSGRAWFITSVVPRFSKMITNPKNVRVVMIQPAGMFQQMTTSLLLKTISTFGLAYKINNFDSYEKGENWVKEGNAQRT